MQKDTVAKPFIKGAILIEPFVKKIIFIKSCTSNSGVNPKLSDFGKDQAEHLGESIKRYLNDEKFVIWTSPTEKAKMTANIILDNLGRHKKRHYDFQIHPKLNAVTGDFQWLQEKLVDFSGENLIIVDDSTYIDEYPLQQGFRIRPCETGQAVLIEDAKCKILPDY